MNCSSRLPSPLRFRRLACLFLVCLSPFALFSSSQAQEAQEKIEVDNVTRNFVVHLPSGYNQQQHYPVVIILHAQNQDADDMERLTHFNLLADKDGVIAIYPVALHGEWNIGVKSEDQDFYQPRRGYGRRGWGYPGGGGGYPGGQSGGENPNSSRTHEEPADDVTFLNQLLDQLPLKYSVDIHRIYAAGLGDGGFMAERAGCDIGDRVAAIAVVGAAFPKRMICLPSRPVSALFISGTDDPIVPYDSGTYKPGHFHVLSADTTAESWAKFDHCGEKPAQTKIPPQEKEKGSKDTKVYTYSGCREDAQVVLYSIKNGGNTWPGGEQYTSEKEIGKTSNAINADETIWNFFSTKRLAENSQPKPPLTQN
jgi:polyhydroxybutyrate depolymerase